MYAVALKRYLPIEHPEALLDVELPRPVVGPRDLLVRVHAISVNPVDTKVRAPKEKIEVNPRVLGWDAAGVVEEVGAEVTLFQPGDKVYYAGDITRAGSNSELQAVDERIVGKMPRSLSFVQAAALPLTSITAWEALFDRLQISLIEDQAKTATISPKRTLLIVGAAGGVGSIAVQLAAKLTQSIVIGTAARAETQSWVKSLGADYVIDHSRPLLEQVQALGFSGVDDILVLNGIDGHFPELAKIVAPQGKICSIIESQQPLPIDQLKMKSVAFLQEFMFTRSMYQTPDMIEQHHLLNRVAQLVDSGEIKTTLTRVLTPINASSLKLAHADIEAGKTMGKIVLSNHSVDIK